MEVRIFIVVGSNMGDKSANCLTSLELIDSDIPDTEVVKKSALYSSPPWGKTDQDDFVNVAAELRSELSPTGLLKALKKIEVDMGRVDSERWGPRLIDIDIVFYGDAVIDVPALTVPHPGTQERAFTLAPLLELAPGFTHPVLGRTIAELLDAVDSSKIKKLNS
ncbi:MAG: 2-amino-4-hydroxy-6-hydroxymethyldihydropteridine diphosphokinase [Thermodesulfobacteriota bacterium]